MTCPHCDGSGWLVVYRNGIEAVRQCECRTVKTAPLKLPNYDVLSANVAGAVVDAICDLLVDAPKTGPGKSLIADALMSMCETNEAAWWLARRVPELHTRWATCGIPGLRQIFCSRYHPRDGVESVATTEYPEGIPAESPVVEPPLPLLPAGHNSTADKQLESGVKQLAQGKTMRKPN